MPLLVSKHWVRKIYSGRLEIYNLVSENIFINDKALKLAVGLLTPTI